MRKILVILLLVAMMPMGQSATLVNGLGLAGVAQAPLTFERGVDKDSLGGYINHPAGEEDGMLSFKVRVNPGRVGPVIGRGDWQGWQNPVKWRRSFGTVTPNSSAVPTGFRILSRDWSTSKYAYDYSGGTFNFYTSRLSPAFLAESASNSLSLFVDADRPFTYLAVPTSGGIRVFSSGQTVDAIPSEPWLLVWYDTNSTFRDLELNNVTLFNYYQDLEAPVWLVNLQHSPTSISLTSSGLSLVFSGETGYISGLPLSGTRFFEQGDTAGWSSALPGAVVDKARYWTRALRYYPLYVPGRFCSR